MFKEVFEPDNNKSKPSQNKDTNNNNDQNISLADLFLQALDEIEQNRKINIQQYKMEYELPEQNKVIEKLNELSQKNLYYRTYETLSNLTKPSDILYRLSAFPVSLFTPALSKLGPEFLFFSQYASSFLQSKLYNMVFPSYQTLTGEYVREYSKPFIADTFNKLFEYLVYAPLQGPFNKQLLSRTLLPSLENALAFFSVSLAPLLSSHLYTLGSLNQSMELYQRRKKSSLDYLGNIADQLLSLGYRVSVLPKLLSVIAGELGHGLLAGKLYNYASTLSYDYTTMLGQTLMNLPGLNLIYSGIINPLHTYAREFLSNFPLFLQPLIQYTLPYQLSGLLAPLIQHLPISQLASQFILQSLPLSSYLFSPISSTLLPLYLIRLTVRLFKSLTTSGPKPPKYIDAFQLSQQLSGSKYLNPYITLILQDENLAKQISPLEPFILQELTLIEQHTAILPAIYNLLQSKFETDRFSQELGQEQYKTDFEYYTREENIFQKSLSSISRFLTKLSVLSNPLTLLYYKFKGYTIQDIMKMIDLDKIHKQQIEQYKQIYGINEKTIQLLNIQPAQLIKDIPTFEGKLITLMTILVDIAKEQLRELVTIRHGLGIKQQIVAKLEEIEPVKTSEMIASLFTKITERLNNAITKIIPTETLSKTLAPVEKFIERISNNTLTASLLPFIAVTNPIIYGALYTASILGKREKLKNILQFTNYEYFRPETIESSTTQLLSYNDKIYNILVEIRDILTDMIKLQLSDTIQKVIIVGQKTILETCDTCVTYKYTEISRAGIKHSISGEKIQKLAKRLELLKPVELGKVFEFSIEPKYKEPIISKVKQQSPEKKTLQIFSPQAGAVNLKALYELGIPSIGLAFLSNYLDPKLLLTLGSIIPASYLIYKQFEKTSLHKILNDKYRKLKQLYDEKTWENFKKSFLEKKYYDTVDEAKRAARIFAILDLTYGNLFKLIEKAYSKTKEKREELIQKLSNITEYVKNKKIKKTETGKESANRLEQNRLYRALRYRYLKSLRHGREYFDNEKELKQYAIITTALGLLYEDFPNIIKQQLTKYKDTLKEKWNKTFDKLTQRRKELKQKFIGPKFILDTSIMQGIDLDKQLGLMPYSHHVETEKFFKTYIKNEAIRQRELRKVTKQLRTKFEKLSRPDEKDVSYLAYVTRNILEQYRNRNTQEQIQQPAPENVSQKSTTIQITNIDNVLLKLLDCLCNNRTITNNDTTDDNILTVKERLEKKIKEQEHKATIETAQHIEHIDEYFTGGKFSEDISQLIRKTLFHKYLRDAYMGSSNDISSSDSGGDTNINFNYEKDEKKPDKDKKPQKDNKGKRQRGGITEKIKNTVNKIKDKITKNRLVNAIAKSGIGRFVGKAISFGARLIPRIGLSLLEGPPGLILAAAITGYELYSTFKGDEDNYIDRTWYLLNLASDKIRQQKYNEYLKSLDTDEQKEFQDTYNKIRTYLYKFITDRNTINEIQKFDTILARLQKQPNNKLYQNLLENQKRIILDKLKEFVGQDTYEKYFSSIEPDKLFKIIYAYAHKYIGYEQLYKNYISKQKRLKELEQLYTKTKDDKIKEQISVTKSELEQLSNAIEQYKPFISDIEKTLNINIEKQLTQQEIQAQRISEKIQQEQKQSEKTTTTQQKEKESQPVVINQNIQQNKTTDSDKKLLEHHERVVNQIFDNSLPFMTYGALFYTGME
jgi:hypothetical protein